MVQQGLSKALKGRKSLPTLTFDEEKDELVEKGCSATLLYLGMRYFMRGYKKEYNCQVVNEAKKFIYDKAFYKSFVLEETILHSVDENSLMSLIKLL